MSTASPSVARRSKSGKPTRVDATTIRATSIPTPLDPNFQGYARVLTDDDGRYRFKTIKPGAYPMNPMNPTAVRTPHIHFDIAGKRTHLVTQMYFPGEKLNAGDRIFSAMGANGSSTIATLLPPADDMAASERLFGWDIVLA